MRKTVVGVDFSVSSPAICIFSGDINNFNIDQCNFKYLTKSKKYSELNEDNIEGGCTLENDILDIDRLSHLSDMVISSIYESNYDNDCHEVSVAIEDYAHQGNGKITLLAENVGLLKYKLREEQYPFISYAPTTIKAFARKFLHDDRQKNSKGNKTKMGKEEMYEAFFNDTQIDLLSLFELDTLLTKSGNPKNNNPITDIVDAYFICKYHCEELKKGK